MLTLTILFKKILTKKCVLCRFGQSFGDPHNKHTHMHRPLMTHQHLIYYLSWATLVCRLTIKTIALSVLVLRGVSVDMVPKLKLFTCHILFGLFSLAGDQSSSTPIYTLVSFLRPCLKSWLDCSFQMVNNIVLKKTQAIFKNFPILF